MDFFNFWVWANVRMGSTGGMQGTEWKTVDVVWPCHVQSQRQVQRRFDAYLAGKPPPGQRVSNDSPTAANDPDPAAPQNQPSKRTSKPCKRVQSGGAGPSDEHSCAAERLTSAVREVVASCVASRLLPDADYPSPLLQTPSAKQAKVLPATTRCVLSKPVPTVVFTH